MLLNAICHNLKQLAGLLQKLTDKTYTAKLEVLNQSSLGMHVRHIVEFYQCLEKATYTGMVNYDDRKRNKLLETDRIACIQEIEKIIIFIKEVKLERLLRLQCDYDLDSEREEPLEIETSIVRELQYNLEHSVHHMAIIRIGVSILDDTIKLSPDFGVATSTLRKRELCAP
jgi:hypothetical protein